MRWKSRVRFGGGINETYYPKVEQGALFLSLSYKALGQCGGKLGQPDANQLRRRRAAVRRERASRGKGSSY